MIITTLRTRAGYNKAQLSKLAGLAPGILTRLEACRTIPRLETISKLAAVLKVDTEWLRQAINREHAKILPFRNGRQRYRFTEKEYQETYGSNYNREYYRYRRALDPAYSPSRRKWLKHIEEKGMETDG